MDFFRLADYRFAVLLNLRNPFLYYAAWLCSGALSLCLAQTDAGLKNALQLLTRAQSQASNAQRINLYEEAIEQCRLIAKTSSNYCAAQTVWAISLVDLAQIVTQSIESADYSHQAQTRLALAEQCDPQSWLVHQTWGRLLLFEAERQPSAPKTAERLLVPAQLRFEKARQAAAFKSDQADADYHASLCLIRRAEQTADRPQKLTLYAAAARLCERAAQVTGFVKAAQVQGLWGVVLLEMGKLEGDRRSIRQGVERLQFSLKTSANDLQARYNLACAYAVLEQSDLAIKELRVCVEGDPTGKYRRAAEKDQDFATLRHRDEFRELVPASN
ncbi:MAG: hypothetical protein PCFJNLEI_00696 [Verrucomicrobiae bacterium]|nr:hypothetical protein [Verrucomicrobiae bacterium]